jgi:hypothetical protein
MLSLYFQDQIRGVKEDRKVMMDLGRGTVQYVGAQVGEPPELTLRGITIYGVLVSNSSGSSSGPIETSRHWWVIVAPPELAAELEAGPPRIIRTGV